MTFKTRYRSYPDSRFSIGTYPNGNKALQVFDNEGLVCTCSVNPGRKVADDCIAIKDYSENEGMADTLTKMEIIGERVGEIPSGFVVIPVFKLTQKGLDLFKKEVQNG